MTSNQVKFDEHEFPLRKKKMVEQYFRIIPSPQTFYLNHLRMSNGLFTTISILSIVCVESWSA
jgi:hypothetical protein